MVKPTWTVCCDVSGDGDFADAGEDITNDVLAVNWTLGMSRPFQAIASPSSATLVLNNSATNSAGLAGLYSPEHANALTGFTKGRVIRIQSTYSATTRTHGYWWIDDIQPTAGEYGERLAKVKCSGFLRRAQSEPSFVELQLSATASDLINALLADASLYPPAATGFWFLGNLGASELGVSTRLGAVATYSDFDTGISTFPYAFDNSSRDASLYAQLRLVAESECGRIFIDRDSKLVLWDRHHLVKLMASLETFNNTMHGINYSYAADVKNDVTIKHEPRDLDETGTPTLATLNRSIKIGAGETKTTRLSYDDGSGNRISTTDGIQPVSTTDYTAHSADDGTGTNMTDSFVVTAVFEARHAELTIYNGAAVPGYLDAGSKVRGNNKLTSYGRMETRKVDGDSIANYGRHAMTVNARLLESATIAEDMCNWLLSQRKDPRGNIQTVTIKGYKNATLLTAALARTMGDRITLQESQTGTDADYFIIGERHSLANGGDDYQTMWYLEAAGAQQFWQLGEAGYSELGETTYLGY